MSRTPRRLLPPAGGPTQVEKLELQQFARRLHERLNRLGMSQSDLARAVWGEATDPRGYKVARNRDSISRYLAGRSRPEPATLAKMCEVLEVDPAWLAPEITLSAVERENPELAMVSIAGHPDKALLQVNMLVPVFLAAQVVTLLTGAINAPAHDYYPPRERPDRSKGEDKSDD